MYFANRGKALIPLLESNSYKFYHEQFKKIF